MIDLDRIHDALQAGECIDSVQPWASDPNLLNISVSGRVVARIPASDGQSLDLAAGMRLDPPLVASLQRCIERDRARKAAFALLARRDFSCAEMAQRLKQRGFDAQLCDAIVRDLERDQWIDERRYAERLVAEAIERGKVAKPVLQQILERRLIQPQIAQSTMTSALAQIDPYQSAVQLGRERLGGMGGLSPATKARRISGLLTRRGFDEHLIGDVLAELGLLDDQAAD